MLLYTLHAKGIVARVADLHNLCPRYVFRKCYHLITRLFTQSPDLCELYFDDRQGVNCSPPSDDVLFWHLHIEKKYSCRCTKTHFTCLNKTPNDVESIWSHDDDTPDASDVNQEKNKKTEEVAGAAFKALQVLYTCRPHRPCHSSFEGVSGCATYCRGIFCNTVDAFVECVTCKTHHFAKVCREHLAFYTLVYKHFRRSSVRH